MSKYIIYSAKSGVVWRELDQYIVEEDGTIFGGICGENTLRYPPIVKPAILEIDEETFHNLDEDLSKYIVQDGELVKINK